MKYILSISQLLLLSAITFAQVNTFDNNIILEPGVSCPAGTEITPVQNAAFEAAIIQMTNDLRAQNNLPPLRRSESLSQSARYHAKDMCNFNYFSHTSQDGNGNTVCSAFSRIGAFYTWAAAAENICAGYGNPAAAFSAWVQSSGHLANMLSSNVYEIGVGYASATGITYGNRWVMNLGKQSGIYPIIINNEADTSSSTQLSVFAYGSGVFSQMRFKVNNNPFGAWQPFAAQSLLDVAGENNGICSVQAELKNAAETLTVSSVDSIILQQTLLQSPPLPPIGIVVRVKALLQGCYNPSTGLMSTALQNNNTLPLSQPFNNPPWGYAGTETLNALPSNMTDWVLLELRDANNNGQIVARRAAILLNNGNIIDVNGNNNGVVFSAITPNSYYILLRTRHHLAVLSSNALALPNDATLCDFSNENMVSGGASQLHTSSTPNICLLLSGDVDGNGTITVGDFNRLQSNMSSMGVYNSSDCNLDRNVTVADYNLYMPNLSIIGVPQVRY